MKLSIITVNLNNREGLKKTLDSVACQTWRDFEHIIIDGASTDGSVDVIREYAQGSGPISISHQSSAIKWLSEKDTGIYNAMNKGIRMSEGEYCLFLNSGDWLNSDNVLEELDRFHITEDIIYGNSRFMLGGTCVEERSYPDELSMSFLIHFSLAHNATLIRSSLFEKTQYSEDLRIVSDWEFFLKQAYGNASFLHIPITISCFSMDGISSTQSHLVEQERKLVLKRVFPKVVQKDIEDNIQVVCSEGERYSLIKEYEAKYRFYRRFNTLIVMLLGIFRK